MSKRPSVPLFAEDRIEREKMGPPQQTGSQQPIHGGDRYGASLQTSFSQEELLDFSANINPLGMPKSIKEAILKGLSSSVHYPDPFCRLLRAELAKKEGVEAENILCGNGGADLIYRLLQLPSGICPEAKARSGNGPHLCRIRGSLTPGRSADTSLHASKIHEA